QVSNSFGAVNSVTATITMVQPGADPAVPQRGVAMRDTAKAPAPISGTPALARARARIGVPAGSAAPSVVIAQPGGVAPPAFLDADEDDGRCAAARIDAVIAWALLSRRAGAAATMTDALAELLRALAVLEDPVCRISGGGRQ
ncbi:MAG TPA: hypothetical protein VMS54_13545, partial [Vicinamibacterales bacterium]|nr:hypothetical protein [Vicinamibacterales bacterium]